MSKQPETLTCFTDGFFVPPTRTTSEEGTQTTTTNKDK